MLWRCASPTTQLFAESTLDGTGYVGLRLIGSSREALTAYANDWRGFSHLRTGEVHALSTCTCSSACIC